MEFCASLHSRSYKNLFCSFDLAESAAIKVNNLSLISYLLSGSTIEVLKRTLKSDSDIGHRLRHNFIQSSHSSSKVTSFDLSSFCIDDFAERVLV